MRAPREARPERRFRQIGVAAATAWKVATVLGLVTQPGCAGTLDNPAAFTTGIDDGGGTPCGDVPSTLLAPTCGVSGCHSPPTNQGGLDLASSGVGGRLVDHLAMGGSGKLIDSQNPDRSVILTKVQPNPPFGAVMPLGKPPLTSDQLQCLRAWVVALAAASGADAGAE